MIPIVPQPAKLQPEPSLISSSIDELVMPLTIIGSRTKMQVTRRKSSEYGYHVQLGNISPKCKSPLNVRREVSLHYKDLIAPLELLDNDEQSISEEEVPH